MGALISELFLKFEGIDFTYMYISIAGFTVNPLTISHGPTPQYGLI